MGGRQARACGGSGPGTPAIRRLPESQSSGWPTAKSGAGRRCRRRPPGALSRGRGALEMNWGIGKDLPYLPWPAGTGPRSPATGPHPQGQDPSLATTKALATLRKLLKPAPSPVEMLRPVAEASCPAPGRSGSHWPARSPTPPTPLTLLTLLTHRPARSGGRPECRQCQRCRRSHRAVPPGLPDRRATLAGAAGRAFDARAVKCQQCRQRQRYRPPLDARPSDPPRFSEEGLGSAGSLNRGVRPPGNRGCITALRSRARPECQQCQQCQQCRRRFRSVRRSSEFRARTGPPDRSRGRVRSRPGRPTAR